MFKNKKITIVLVIVGIVLLCVILAVCFLMMNSSKETEEEKKIIKNYKIEDYVKDAEYSKKGIEGYDSSISGLEAAKQIVLPLINIDSKDGNKANGEIKSFFDKIADNYKKKNKFSMVHYSASYSTYLNKNVLSIEINIYEILGSEQKNNILVYNFDLNNKKILSFSQLIKQKGITQEELDEKIKIQIENICVGYNGKDKDKMYKKIYSVYKKIIDTDDGNYCLSENNKIKVFLEDEEFPNGYLTIEE